LTVFDQMGVARLQTMPSDETYGISVKQYLTSHGTLMIAKHRLLENGPGGFGYGNTGIAVDPTRLKKRFLRGRDTKLEEHIQANDSDTEKGQYISEVGWEVRAPLIHGILSNVTG
jgi:hypothetical protein